MVKHSKLAVFAGVIAGSGLAYWVWRRIRRTRNADVDVIHFQKVSTLDIPKKTNNENVGKKAEKSEFKVSPVSGSDRIESTLAHQSREGVFVYDHLGAVLRLPPSWKVAEDVSPVPNVAMITLKHTDHISNDTPGAAPIVVLSVEDTSLVGQDLHEFKETSKANAMQQMYAMTQGMVPPQVVFDGPENNGPFKMTLQYNMMAPFMQMKVVNFLTLENDLAYVLQFMGSPDVYEKYEKDVRDIARQFQINKLPYTGPSSSTIVSSSSGAFTISLPVSWILLSIAKSPTELLEAETPSPNKTERVELLKPADGGMWSQEKLLHIAKENRGTSFSMTQKDDILTATYKNVGGHHVCLIATGAFCLRVSPLKSKKSILKESELEKIVRSITSSATHDEITYHNRRNRYRFSVKLKSRLVESRIGDNAITMAPEGMEPGSAATEATPIFTVRCGDPSSDKDCEPTLEQWLDRLQQEAARSEVRISDLKMDKLCGHDCVTFSQQEAQEIGSGSKEEHQARIVVFVEDGKTYMLRWETPSLVWSKFEGKFQDLLSTFHIVSA
mmetsp:Transcript_353/g.496  ORF Transcript_353/g.496 Transcript_353/m.496 type:complete len:555 (+) Transcript_353:48-1712(+)